jgi:hypothetical protein
MSCLAYSASSFPASYGRYHALPTLEIQAPKCVWYCYNPWDPRACPLSSSSRTLSFPPMVNTLTP